MPATPPAKAPHTLLDPFTIGTGLKVYSALSQRGTKRTVDELVREHSALAERHNSLVQDHEELIEHHNALLERVQYMERAPAQTAIWLSGVALIMAALALVLTLF